MPKVAILVGSAVVATVALVGGGVLARGGDDEPDHTQPEQTFATTALSDFDIASVTVTRGTFCDAIDDRQVEAVLGETPDPLTWANGDEVDLADTGHADVVHEFGCRYAVQDVGVAQAWVFAPPVDSARAERMVKSAQKGPGCEVGTGPAFGSPTLALSCTTKNGTTRASYRGLFGDAWLVCEVELAPAAGVDVVDVAGRWCVGVLEAAGGAPA